MNNNNNLQHRVTRLCYWLEEHPLINKTGLCSIIGYDQSNLNKVMQGKAGISEYYVALFEEQLKDYGYKS